MQTHNITILVVDDDPPSRQLIERHLSSIPGITLLPSASEAETALSSILEHSPDLLFLDVEMPGKSGFDLLEELRKLDLSPCIVFQTAYNQYAIEAIRHAAFDYLLKPVDKEDLLKVLARYRGHCQQDGLTGKLDELIRHLHEHQKIRFNTRHGFLMIDPSDILFCQADWSYTELWFDRERKEIVSMNIGKVSGLLPVGMFAKISRSILVNTKFIDKFDRKSRVITLQKDGETFEFKVAGSMVKGI